MSQESGWGIQFALVIFLTFALSMQLEAAFVRTALKSQSFGVLAFVLPEETLKFMTINQCLLTVHI